MVSQFYCPVSKFPQKPDWANFKLSTVRKCAQSGFWELLKLDGRIELIKAIRTLPLHICFVHLRPLPNSQIPKFSNRQFYSIFFWFLTRNFLEMPEGLNWYEKWLIRHSDIMAPLKNLWLKTRKIANKFGNLRIWKFENLAKALNEHNTCSECE